MIKTSEVIKTFIKYLSQEKISYADSFNNDIYRILDLDNYENNSFVYFFKKFNTVDEIITWIGVVKSAIVMHEEEEDNIDEIIFDYIEFLKKSSV